MADTPNPDKPVVQEVSSPTTQNDPKQKEGEPPARGGSCVNIPPAPKYEDNPTEKEKEPRRWREFISKYLPYVLSALALGVSFSSQNASWESARNSKRSADAAEKSAAAAQRNANAAEKALALSIRPQLTVERIFDLVLVPGRGVELKLQLVNTGNGSARSPSTTILIDTCPREIGGECFDACPTKTDSKRMIPGSWANVDPKMSVTWVYQDYSLTSAEETESITTGTRLLYVCGVHSYTDLVSNPYDSFFCFVYDGSVKRWGSCGIGPRGKEKENAK